MKRTKRERALKRLAKYVSMRLEPELADYMKKHVDMEASFAFSVLARRLCAAREEKEKNFKRFCKSNGFKQYKVKAIENAYLNELDLRIVEAYIRVIGAEVIVKEWADAFPKMAAKYLPFL